MNQSIGNVDDAVESGFYIGLNSMKSFDNELTWSSGAPLLFTNWAMEEPSDVNNTEKCTFYNAENGYWVRTLRIYYN